MPGKRKKIGKGSRSQRNIGPRRRRFAVKHEVTCMLAFQLLHIYTGLP